MKYLILVGDGMGGHPLSELGQRTTLEAAKTPEMDRLCGQGELLLTKTVPDGFPPGSDVANLSLMGYDPALYYTGRAPLEAAAMGIQLGADETAFRCNLVTLEFTGKDKATMVDFSAQHITTEEAAQLIHALNEACGNEMFTFYTGVRYRHLLVVQGDIPPFTTVPPHDYIEKDVSSFRQDYFISATWKELIERADAVLAKHPVNVKRRENGLLPATAIWPWGEGKMPHMPTLKDKFSFSGGMISAVDLLKGIGVNAGLSVIDVPGATGFIDTNYQGKADAALEILENDDFVFVHLEAPDESGHQGSIKNKIKAIEDFDEKIVGYITRKLDEKRVDYRAIVTMDHFTPIALRTHTAELVPTILYDSRNTRDNTLSFCEKTASTHNVPVLENGYKLINTLFEKPCR